MLTHKGTQVIEAPDPATWRAWLAANGTTEKRVWLRCYKKDSGKPSVTWEDSVDEAICYGWIDGVVNKLDEESFVRYYTPRQPKSNWSRINKAKVERLMAAGLIMPEGMAVIDLAKRNGTWTGLDDVENLLLPPDLAAAFAAADAVALQNWEGFSRSVKRGLLEQLLQVKGAETRQRRVAMLVDKALRNDRKV
jgi:uncharacterized protein YdeI (YjbR/CyaY-like superfamily)